MLEFADDGATTVLDADPEYPVAYGILLDHSDARVENMTLRGTIDAGGEIWVGGVVIDGGSPVIEGIDVILDDDPYPADYGWLARSAFQITGESTAVIRSSSWDGSRGSSDSRHRRRSRATLKVPDGSALTLDGNTVCEARPSDSP